MKKFEDYYVGLDMGTGSVGWAVTDPSYNIIKRHGKALWGIRLFDSAKTAEERRAFRTSRRRTDRRKNRLALLQEIFAEEISKKDAGFYQRMKESKYWHEDKRDINGNMLELPYALFADEGFTDKDYYKKYPTIFHLRYELATNTTDKPDIRLVYLALHHIIKHRGHFLFEGKKLSEVKNFSTAIEALEQQAAELDIDLALTDEMKLELEEIMKDTQSSKSDKKSHASKVFAGTDKQKKAIAALMTGCTVKLGDIFNDEELDKEDNNKICFSDSSYEDKEAEYESLLVDRFLLIIAAKGVYDWAVLHDILGEARFLSEAKKNAYDKHRDDLQRVKKLFRADKSIYDAVFGASDKKEANYSAYIGMARCMYSGDVIDIDELFTNRYDIDHIYPQSKVMDDSIDNRVLVRRQLNSNKKDIYPVLQEYFDKAKPLWDALLKKGMITKEKYKRLTRREPFSENELAGFIARQLVETRQSTKAVAQLLGKEYPDSNIVYAKAHAVSEFRHKFGMIKVREVNDYHHAKDAYLNIVVGNTYFIKFTKDAAWFVRNNPGRTYNLQKMFEKETVQRGGETAWIPGEEGTITTVKKWMNKNNIMFTRRAYEVKGGLFDQNILKKGKGQIPIKGGAGERLKDIDKYGAYNKASGAYFMLVESDGKKGVRKRTIEFVPVYLAKQLEGSTELQRKYCEDELGLVNPDIRLAKIKIDTLFDVDGFKMHLSGRTGNRLVFKGGNQLVLADDIQRMLKKALKYCADYRENKNAILSEKAEITSDKLEQVYDVLLDKLESTIYAKRLSVQAEKLKNSREQFVKMSNEQKCIVLAETLHLFQCSSQSANLTLLDGPGHAGILLLNNDLSKLDNISIINQSITGFYEQVIDLKTI